MGTGDPGLGARQRWLLERQRSLGGSEAPLILGLVPRASRGSVWAEKRGLRPSSAPDSVRLRLGRYLEPLIAKLFEEEAGMRVIQPRKKFLGRALQVHRFVDGESANVLVRHRDRPWMHATPDGLVQDEGGLALYEAKTVEAFRAHEWREGIPEPVRIQARHNCAVLGLNRAYVAALIGFTRFTWGMVRFTDDDLTEAIRVAKEFMDDVENDSVAMDPGPLAVEPGKQIAVLPISALSLADRYQKAGRLLARMEAIRRDARDYLLAMLGEHEEAVFPDGTRLRSVRVEVKERVLPASVHIRLQVTKVKS